MSGKRAAQASTSSKEEPPAKKSFVAIPPVNLGKVSTEEELDKKVLKFQNQKLYTRLEEKNSQEEEFKAKISQLERIRVNDQAIISLLNRAWNQLDAEVMILLRRFDGSLGDFENSVAISETTVAFLEKLSDRTTKGMEEEIGKRVFSSKDLICKLVRLIDKTVSRGDDIAKLLQGSQNVKKDKDNQDIKEENQEKETKTDSASDKEEEDAQKAEEEREEAGFTIAAIELAIKQENAEVKQENRRLHDLVTSLHEKHHSMSSEFTELHDKLATAQKEVSELTSKTADMQYDLQKSQHQIEKLIKRINEMQTSGKGGGGAFKGIFGPGTNQQMDEIRFELEEQRELAENRLKELETTQETNSNLVKEHEKLKLENQSSPEDAVVKTATYKTLQTQFTLLFSEAQTLKGQAEEARRIILTNKSHHLIQMEVIESEAALTRKKLRTEVSHLEKALVESRRELELLRVEYEHNMKAHEQIGPMAKEMRHLINSLQNHNQQLKGEVMRYKRKLSEASNRISELENQKKESEEKAIAVAEQREKSPEELREDEMKRRSESGSTPKERDTDRESEPSPSTSKTNEIDAVKELKAKLKQAKESQKEMKILLDMYKGASKETREKIELLREEENLKDEINELKEEIIHLHGEIKKKSQKADEDLQRRLKHAEDKISQLQKCLANTKQEEDALLAEMEFTGQAFEEMQEQNIRLMQQLREKDDSNLKLMSERIKANQVQKLLREEKEVLTEQIQTLNIRHQSVEEVIKRLEDREKILQTALQTLEKEATLRQQAGEMHKRKAIETIQHAQELTYKYQEIHKQYEEAKETIVDKSNSLEEESFKCRRMYEENGGLKRKIDKAKKMEYLGASDEILVEEVKMYKAKLTCPCCNTRRKDAILTKCFHVFCFDCLKTRYDTRQRKCPKCNSNFGNNDFHKIYM